MKKQLFLLFVICFTNLFYSQETQIWGEKFPFDTKIETEPSFVLKDNYNYYLLTVVNTYGITAKNQIILRKFDQKNQLVETINYDFPKMDISTLHTYHGTYELGSDKVVVFMESYSGKAKKSQINELIFDKSTGKFTSTTLVTYDILSAMKAGTVEVKKSENGRFIVVNHQKNSSKKEPEQHSLSILNASDLKVIWQKEITFTNDYFTKNVTVTNSGNAIFTRESRSRLSDYMVSVTQEGQEDKNFDQEIKISEPKAISIGDQDYLLAFNRPIKGIRSGDFGFFMLYDLKLGKILTNNKVDEFNKVKLIKDVVFRNIFIQNNEIHVFTEAKAEVEIPKVIGNVGSFGNSFEDPKYNFTPAVLLVLSFEGQLKKEIVLMPNNYGTGNLYHSLGLVNIKGSYFMNAGYGNGIKELDLAKGLNLAPAKKYDFAKTNDPFYERYHSNQFIFVNQLFHYFPDSQRFLVARTHGENEMSVFTVHL